MKMRRYQRCLRYVGAILACYGVFMWCIHNYIYTIELADDADTGRVYRRITPRPVQQDNDNIPHNKTFNETFKALNASNQIALQPMSNNTGNSTLHKNGTSNSSEVHIHNETISSNNGTNSTLNKLDLKIKLPNGDRPLLSLFTSFIHGRPFSDIIHRRTLKNWGSLSPYIWPYLFVNRNDSDTWNKLGEQERWQTIEEDEYLDGNLPVLKSMFQTLEYNSDSTFIGFANDDILFDETLLRTLTYLKKAVKNVEHRDLMLVGRRRDYLLKTNDSISIGGDFISLSAQSHQLQLSGPDAIDYVIFSRAGFKWDNVPNIAVGAKALTNYILSMAMEWNYIIIEVTSSVDIIHQTEAIDRQLWVRGGNYSNDPNIAIYRKGHINYEDILERGQTLCVSFITICRRWTGEAAKRNLGCNFALAKRKKIPKYCQMRANYHSKGPIKRPKQSARNGRNPRSPDPEEYDTFEGIMQQL